MAVISPKHPPIPPNCESFVSNGGLCLLIPESEDGSEVCVSINQCDKAWRPIIAAVARCAWIDIADNDQETEQKVYVEAMKNADAWKAWGVER